MKVRINEVGYEFFDGHLGSVEFKGGVSVHDVSQFEIDRMGCVISIVNADTDEQLGVAANIDSVLAQEFPVEVPVNQAGFQQAVVSSAGTKLYTAEELGEIADKEGISGLRKIADTVNVKGTSIAKLIQLILEAQVPSPPVTNPAPDVVPDQTGNDDVGEEAAETVEAPAETTDAPEASQDAQEASQDAPAEEAASEAPAEVASPADAPAEQAPEAPANDVQPE